MPRLSCMGLYLLRNLMSRRIPYLILSRVGLVRLTMPPPLSAFSALTRVVLAILAKPAARRASPSISNSISDFCASRVEERTREVEERGSLSSAPSVPSPPPLSAAALARSMLSDVLGTGVAAPLPDRGVIETNAGLSSRRDTCGVWNCSSCSAVCDAIASSNSTRLCAIKSRARLRRK